MLVPVPPLTPLRTKPPRPDDIPVPGDQFLHRLGFLVHCRGRHKRPAELIEVPCAGNLALEPEPSSGLLQASSRLQSTQPLPALSNLPFEIESCGLPLQAACGTQALELLTTSRQQRVERLKLPRPRCLLGSNSSFKARSRDLPREVSGFASEGGLAST
jgi:hypothetical protein